MKNGTSVTRVCNKNIGNYVTNNVILERWRGNCHHTKIEIL